MIIATSPEKRAKRFTKQLTRVAREMEAIRELGETSINVVHLAVNFGKIAVCQRTVARDLQALEIAGMVSSRRVSVWQPGGKKRSVFLYSLATPVELQRRLSLIKRLTKRELALLIDGKMPADSTALELLGTTAKAALDI